ncbi:acyltransferase family protein [Falsihalocynthiibacter sp. S25ZX9]|uniref:acyltransferase family protein n=1 Tax=Falsihalocynthiibacter sp. S25ZX9 TaxID=3240870 RepID=UPI00350F0313
MKHTLGPKSVYRADIDGLRAVAVTAVILYHLERSFIPGGYFGVDMFFVLSGYLITGIIWSEIRADSFSLSHFYERRIRRIMPALLLFLIVITVFASIILLPSDLANYGKSVLATLTFSANVYFWRDTNYFSSSAEEKPLLHLWSLGVEEQFYILFPLILWFLARYRDRTVVAILSCLIAVSLACHIFLTLIGGSSPAFFLLPSRAWEMGAGSLLAICHVGKPGTKTANITGVFGLGIILYSFFGPPLVIAQAPDSTLTVVGTVLLIWTGRSDISAINRLLSLKPIVFIGLLSYALYLWHWPIISLAKYYLLRDLTLMESLAALILTGTAAALSWRYVEQPFRSTKLPFSKVGTITATSVVLLGGIALSLTLASGFPQRLNKEAGVINAAVGTNFRCALQDYFPYGEGRACVLNLDGYGVQEAEVILLGNSHAQMYAPVWKTILEAGHTRGFLVPQNGCLPTVSANIGMECLQSAQRILDEIATHTSAKIVILSMTWKYGPSGLVDASGTILDNTGNAALIAAIDDLVKALESFDKTVILVGPIAVPGVDIASITGRELAYGRILSLPPSLPKHAFLEQYDPVFAHFSNRDDLLFVRPDSVLCDDAACYYIRDEVSYFADSNHLAEAEVYRFEPLFSETFTRALDQSRIPIEE